MTYAVHVSGRRNDMIFDQLSSADRYRRVVLGAGVFAWIS